MSKKVFFAVVLIILGLALAVYYVFVFSKEKLAGLKIISIPDASIFIDEKLIGKTPYDEKYPAGEYSLKLIPEETSGTASSWQGRITLRPALMTFIKRELGPSENTSAGEIVSLEKISGDQTQLAITAIPDGAKVAIDGIEKGAAPFILKDAITGEYDVSVSSPGFSGRTVRVKTMTGYKLTVAFQLELSQQTTAATDSADLDSSGKEDADSEGVKSNQIMIKDTPTGFLRVRSEPSTASKELGQVKPQEKFTLLEEKEGWFKIAYEEGGEGWVSSRYAEKVSP